MNQPGGENTSNGDQRPAKRTKTRLACQECRDRKIRCDGGRPLCNSCARKGIGPDRCTYVEPQAEVAPEYVRALESRIRELEQRNGSVPQDLPVHRHDSHPHFHVEAAPLHAHPRAHHDQTPENLSLATPALVPSPGLSSHGAYIPIANLVHPEDATPREVQSGLPERRDMLSPAQGQPSMVGAIQCTPAETQPFAPPRSVSQTPYLVNHQPEDVDPNGGDLQTASVMGATEGTPTTSTGSVFLGRSSVAAFMKEVRQAARKRSHSEFAADETASSTASRASRNPTKKEKNEMLRLLEELTLPPRQVADAHLSNYWEFVWPLYPILHRPSFMRKYERIWSHNPAQATDSEAEESQETVHSLRSFHAMFNMILALGCIYSSSHGPSPSSKKSADVFFNRAQGLITNESVDYGDMQLVQALILTAQYLQSTDLVNRCWATVGMAIRVAQGIGVHLDLPSESQAGRQERKRTWWCCILMDRALSMTFGRPPMVVWPSVVPFPDIVDDEYLSIEPGSANQPVQHQEVSKIAFFVHALRLTKILLNVLKVFYAPPIEERQPGLNGFRTEDCSSLLDLDGELSKWRRELPSYLHYYPAVTGDRDSNPIFLRQSASLHCRYLHLKILLFRPMTVELARGGFFEKRYDDGTITDLQRTVAKGCVRSIVSSAQETIQVLYDGNAAGRSPPWWYSVFYLYTSGAVILAMLQSPILRGTIDEQVDSLQASWKRCVECLTYYEELSGAFAKRCLWMLQTAHAQGEQQDLSSTGDTLANGTNQDLSASHTQGALFMGRPFLGDLSADNPLAEGVLLDSWWPSGSMDWLGSIPMEFQRSGQGEVGGMMM